MTEVQIFQNIDKIIIILFIISEVLEKRYIHKRLSNQHFQIERLKDEIEILKLRLSYRENKEEDKK